MSLDNVFLSFFLSLSAWVFVNVMQDEDMIFERWRRVLDRLPKWASHPLGKCDLCLAGQLGLWGYFLADGYHFFEHVFFICLTIFFVKVIDRFLWGT